MSSPEENTPQQQGGLLAAISHRWEQYTSRREALSLAAGFFFRELWRNFREGNFGVLLNFHDTQERAFAKFFKSVEHGFANYERTTAVPSLVASAHGVVLDLGPGTGNQLPYFDSTNVQHIFGVESNTFLAPYLVNRVEKEGWQGKYTPIFCGIEDAAELQKHGIVPGSVDCVTSMQVLCSVKEPAEVVRQLYSLLKPGGEFIFWEHQRSSNWITRSVQWLWSPFWAAFIGGCRLDKPIKDSILGAGDWETVQIEGDNDGTLIMPRIWGRLIKRRE